MKNKITEELFQSVTNVLAERVGPAAACNFATLNAVEMQVQKSFIMVAMYNATTDEYWNMEFFLNKPDDLQKALDKFRDLEVNGQ